MFQRPQNMHFGLTDIQMYLCRVGLSRMLRPVYTRLTRFFHQISMRDEKKSAESKTGNDLSKKTQDRDPNITKGNKTRLKKEQVAPESIIKQPQ
jgi:hypothetical protein